MMKVTLVGELNAKEGSEFVFEGLQSRCESCQFSRTCGSLKPGRSYEVTSLREGRVQKCPLHEGGVKAVEVEETAIEAAVPSRKAVEGSKVSVSPPSRCPEDCPNWGLCHVSGADGEKLGVQEVLGSPPAPCPLDIDLTTVKLKG